MTLFYSSNNTVKWFLILAVVVHSTVHTVGAPVQLRPVTDSNGVFPQAAVTSDAQLCSDLGKYVVSRVEWFILNSNNDYVTDQRYLFRDVLQRNGSTVDAVITVQLCLGLFVPQSMGIGGGFYMTIYDKKSQKVVVIDARERAPGASTENMFLGNASLSEKGKWKWWLKISIYL